MNHTYLMMLLGAAGMGRSRRIPTRGMDFLRATCRLAGEHGASSMTGYAHRVDANHGATACKRCGSPTERGRSFCSARCAARARWGSDGRDSWIGICATCGNGFGRDSHGRMPKYCSRLCAGRSVGANGKSRIRHPPKKSSCAECGSVFATYHRDKRFCDRGCFSMYWRKHAKARGLTGSRDHNHAEISDALTAFGCWVIDLSRMGGGVPDLLVIHHGEIRLIEIKNLKTSYGRAGLNPKQIKFREFVESHGCKIHIVTSVDDALRLHGARV